LEEEAVAQNSWKNTTVAKILLDSREMNTHFEKRRKKCGALGYFRPVSTFRFMNINCSDSNYFSGVISDFQFSPIITNTEITDRRCGKCLKML